MYRKVLISILLIRSSWDTEFALNTLKKKLFHRELSYVINIYKPIQYNWDQVSKTLDEIIINKKRFTYIRASSRGQLNE